MKDKSSQFWASRYKKVGHTGWQDPFLYAYDQFERLAMISNELTRAKDLPRTILDFGCGTGDFSVPLLEKGMSVWGYDPYVIPKINHPNFIHLNHHSQLETIQERMELIFSITVLDHILVDSEFRKELMLMRSMISEHGKLLMIEYAMDEKTITKNDYQAFRTVKQWKDQLFDTGWEITRITPVPHPVESPSPGFIHYKERMLISVIRKLPVHTPLNFLLIPILKRYAHISFSEFGPGRVEKSPLKLICCKPV
jgi:hypothetical protein